MCYSHKMTKRNADDVERSVHTLADALRRLADAHSGPKAGELKRLATMHEQRIYKIFYDSEVRQ